MPQTKNTPLPIGTPVLLWTYSTKPTPTGRIIGYHDYKDMYEIAIDGGGYTYQYHDGAEEILPEDKDQIDYIRLGIAKGGKITVRKFGGITPRKGIFQRIELASAMECDDLLMCISPTNRCLELFPKTQFQIYFCRGLVLVWRRAVKQWGNSGDLT